MLALWPIPSILRKTCALPRKLPTVFSSCFTRNIFQFSAGPKLPFSLLLQGQHFAHGVGMIIASRCRSLDVRLIYFSTVAVLSNLFPFGERPPFLIIDFILSYWSYHFLILNVLIGDGICRIAALLNRASGISRPGDHGRHVKVFRF